MARTSKSRGSVPFQMRSGNNGTPYKFLGKALRKVGGGVTKLLGGGAGAAKVGGFIGGGGLGGMALGKMGVPGAGMNDPRGGTGIINSVAQARMNADMMGTPMAKKDASPYKRAYLSKGLDTGMYDAISGKGTKKYGDIAKARAFTNMSKSIASATASMHANSLRKAKKDWKKDKKFQKWLNRKEKGWKDRSRWGSVT